ncbi:taurine dioxygenase [Sphingobium faniae]|nr:taurine dioxygenase [Sphingobium faniae]
MFNVRPLDGGMGAQVTEMDFSQPIAKADAERLRQLWIDRGVLVFPQAHIDSARHVALSRVFGEPEVHPAREGHVDGQPALTRIQYDPANSESASIYDVGGRMLANWLPWHIDLIYMPQIARAGCLRGIVIPPESADTGFIDRIALHASLPAALKKQIAGQRILYQLQPMADRHRHFPCPDVRMTHIPDRIQALADRVASDFPVVSHPLEFRQTETGRMVLNFCPLFVHGIEGMGDGEAADLIGQLREHVLGTSHRYMHRWREGDVVLWDNWRMLHSAEGTPVAHPRLLHRTTLAGDYGLGRVYQEEPRTRASAA